MRCARERVDEAPTARRQSPPVTIDDAGLHQSGLYQAVGREWMPPGRGRQLAPIAGPLSDADTATNRDDVWGIHVFHAITPGDRVAGHAAATAKQIGCESDRPR